MTSIPDKLYFRIGEVAKLLGVKPHVLRYWETEFSLVSPRKSAAGHRVYRREDVESLLLIQRLLYEEKYSIEGARKRIQALRKQGALESERSPGIRVEKLARLRELALEVVELSRQPITSLFFS